MKKSLRKAVIPVAGFGTRMLPATKAIPKEMLPVVDKPMIQYIVQECIEAGIKEIVLVTHSSKGAIENHFDVHYELEENLIRGNKNELLEALTVICPDDVSIIAVRQGVAKGLGHAVLCALPVIGNEAFVVLLPDVLIDAYQCDLSRDNLAKMMVLYEETGASQIMVEPVPMDKVSCYGVVDLGGQTLAAGESIPMIQVVEKPSVEDAPSNLTVVGRYVLSSSIWELLKTTGKGAGGEIQLTDAIAALMQQETVNAFNISGKSHDCGSKLGYMMANVAYATQHDALSDDFKVALCDFVASMD
ncbi:MAG: UTP--glucose-1-phosphate uridylyltransferase GalU [Cocleimonas sp.]|nr:UTP--glucose-1-phosphate uridylyltransferase GalU [Cocleimonas sp.]